MRALRRAQADPGRAHADEDRRRAPGPDGRRPGDRRPHRRPQRQGLDAAIDRGHAYVEAGADVLFVEAPRTVEELAGWAASWPGVPLVVNVVEGGKTPQLELKEYADLGFGVVLYANYLMRSMMAAGRRRWPTSPRTARPPPRRTGWRPGRSGRRCSTCRSSARPEARSTTGRGTAHGIPRPAGTRPTCPTGSASSCSGRGLAGCAALLAAAEAGRYAVLLEKTGRVRRARRSGSAGLSAYAGTDEQADQGIADSVDLLRKDLLETGGHVNDEALVDLYCDHQLDTYRWLHGHGCATARCTQRRAVGAALAPHRHHRACCVPLLTAAGRPRCPPRPRHRRPRRPGPGARSRRRRGRRDGGRRPRGCWPTPSSSPPAASPATPSCSSPLRARRWRSALRPGGDGCHRRRAADGLAAGRRRAWTRPTSRAPTASTREPHPNEDGTGILAVYKGAIAVNREGRRFVDESLPYKEIGDAAWPSRASRTWQVFDARVLAASNDEVPIYDFAGRDRAGMLLRRRHGRRAGGTDRRCPGVAGARPSADYNARIAHGPTPWAGRTCPAAVGTPFPLTQPPFYAHPSGTVVLATYCGLTVDTRLRVLDVFGDPIERLYAAGEVIGGFHGGGYMTGTSIGKAGIFGRLAGTHAAAEESELTW